MIQFSKRGMGNFGNLGEEGDSTEFRESPQAGGQEEGGGLNSVVKTVGGLFKAGGGAAGGGMCGACGDKDKEAEENKKKELEKKYPLRDCGPSPTPECTAYNEKMIKLQKEEFEMWRQAKDEAVGETMQPDERQKFGFVAELAQQLKMAHPEAGKMTLSQIRKTYPDDFDKIYEQLKSQFPFLKAIDADTALAMSPGIAGLTLDELIQKTGAISGMGSASRAPISTNTALGLSAVALLALGALFAFRKK